jgi:hypothetical protein
MSLSIVAIQRLWAAFTTSDADVGSISACSDVDDDDPGKHEDGDDNAWKVDGVTPNADTSASVASMATSVATLGFMTECCDSMYTLAMANSIDNTTT